MVKFTDGPASGTSLALQRAPLFLRVVKGPNGKIDALDLVGDKPEPNEAIYVYRKVAGHGTCHIDGRDKTGRRYGVWTQMADYRYSDEQPVDAVARNQTTWEKWCREQLVKEHAQ